MTDPITCPECGGTGEDRAVPGLVMQCQFCYGRGEVGGPDDPQDNPPPPPKVPPPAWDHKVWNSPERAAAGWCRLCLGRGEVIHEDEERRTVISAPCPACSR